MRIKLDIEIPNWTKWLAAGIGIGIVLGGGAVVLAAMSVPHTFADGQTLSAAKLNENFKALQDGINGLPWASAPGGIAYAAGSVGVGVSQPTGGLHVQGAAPVAGAGVLSSSGNSVLGSGTAFTTQLNQGDTLAVGAQWQTVASVESDTQLTTLGVFAPALTSSTFTFQQPIHRDTNNSGVTRMLVNSAGDVGIGTAAPLGKLDVRTDTDDRLVFLAGTASNVTDSWFTVATVYLANHQGGHFTFVWRGEDYSVDFFTQSADGIMARRNAGVVSELYNSHHSGGSTVPEVSTVNNPDSVSIRIRHAAGPAPTNASWSLSFQGACTRIEKG